jgi:hypothetical protein
MTVDEFVLSVQEEEPPAELSGSLKALWWDKKGDWDKAHHLSQSVYDSSGSWVHAYLHRVEGDLANARFWYNRAGKPESTSDLETEWKEIAEYLLSHA